MKSCVCFIWSYCSFNRKRFLHRSIDGDCLFCSPFIACQVSEGLLRCAILSITREFLEKFLWVLLIPNSCMRGPLVHGFNSCFAAPVRFCNRSRSWVLFWGLLMMCNLQSPDGKITWKVSGWFQERVELGWGLIAVPNHPPSYQCSFQNDSSCQKLPVFFTPGCAIFTHVSE